MLFQQISLISTNRNRFPASF